MDSDESVARKRQKTLMACETCRSKKVKCDGQRPVCGNCTRKGWGSDKCIWKHVNGSEEEASGPWVESLQTRIRELEQQVLSARTPRSSLHEEGCEQHSRRSLNPQHGESPNAVSAIEGAATGGPQNEGFIGPGSAAAFLNTVRHVVDPETVSPSDSHLRTQVPQDSRPLDYVLPPRREADALLDLYWMYVHPLYPFLYKPAFQRIYSGLWTGQLSRRGCNSLMHTTEATSVALVNLVLALSYQYSHKWTGSGTGSGTGCVEARTAEVYFSRARNTFRHDLIDGMEQTLQAVQAALLMAQYLASVGSTHRAWEVIGSGIRTSYRLGLHRSSILSEDAGLEGADQEMVKRVWHGCIMLERMISATLGRPAMTAASDQSSTPLPQEIDEDDFQSTGRITLVDNSRVRANKSLMSFFVSSARLFELVEEILTAFSSHDATATSSQPGLDHYFAGSRTVFDLDKKMMNWHRDIPPYLQLGHAANPSVDANGRISVFRRQAAVLQMRYLYSRIYLFKPVLTHVCTALGNNAGTTQDNSISWVHGTLVQRTAIQCSLICVRCAIELIETLHTHNLSAQTWGQKPTWLYAVLHIYLAATVLLAARLAPSLLLAEIPDQRVQTAWDNALAILQGFQADSTSAQKCVAALQLLYRKLPATSTAQNQLVVNQDTAPVGAETSANQEIPTELAVLDDSHNFFNGLNGDFEWTDDAAGWLEGIDFSDPYDMSWFLAPNMDAA